MLPFGYEIIVMLDKTPPIGPTAFADPILTAVHRALAEVQGQRPLRIAGADGWRFALGVDGLDDARLAAFVNDLCGGYAELALSGVRLRMLGAADPAEALVTPIVPGAGWSAARVADLTRGRAPDDLPAFAAAGASAAAAVDLAKLAQRIPAALVSAPMPGPPDAREPAAGAPVRVEVAQIEAFRPRLAATLEPVSEARVPIADGIATRFVVFRDAVGGLASAIIVGAPEPGAEIPVRVHSSCATGDIFGSRRCDCGEQLQLALARLNDLGGGCLIYLDQEGRGLGLANKMHAYTLQDDGLDTVDANMMLGFHDDERDYHAAGVMLRRMGWTRITLLTNNPTKLGGLATAGIEIVERLPVVASVNGDNRRYLETKSRRAGHLLTPSDTLETA